MWFVGEGYLAQAVAVDRQVPQGDQRERFRGYHLSDHLQVEGSLLFLFREEDQPGTVSSLLRDSNTLQQYELVWDLHQDAGAIAGNLVGTLRTAMHHVLEHLHPFLHNVVRFFTREGHHDPYTAGIMLVVKTVE